jgi:hypothetical protein
MEGKERFCTPIISCYLCDIETPQIVGFIEDGGQKRQLVLPVTVRIYAPNSLEQECPRRSYLVRCPVALTCGTNAQKSTPKGLEDCPDAHE